MGRRASRPVRVIRASEVGAFAFCQRAWWYRDQGMEPANKFDLAVGTHIHVRYGRSVRAAEWLRRLAYLSLLGAGALTILYLIGYIR